MNGGNPGNGHPAKVNLTTSADANGAEGRHLRPFEEFRHLVAEHQAFLLAGYDSAHFVREGAMAFVHVISASPTVPLPARPEETVSGARWRSWEYPPRGGSRHAAAL